MDTSFHSVRARQPPPRIAAAAPKPEPPDAQENILAGIVFTPAPVKKRWSDPAMSDAIRSFAEAQSLPMLRAVNSIEEFIAFDGAMHDAYAFGFEETVVNTHMDLAFGRFDAALTPL